MMSLGSLGNGGLSSSSSNLSALAPPFTVDRSNPKPNSNPLVHFSELPYPVPFHSSFHNWQYSNSSASIPDLYSNLDSEVDSIRTTCLPSANDYVYLGSHSVSSSSTHMPPISPNVTAATDAFSFQQYSSDIPRNHVETKSYYPPFVSPVVDNDSPLVALNEPSYDLSSTSHIAPLDGSSQVDYIQRLCGLDYTPQWGSFWNRLADREQGKRVELDGSFCSEETNVPPPYVYKDYMKQGACTAEGSSKCEEASAVSHRKVANVWGRESQITSPNTGMLDDKSLSLQGPRFISGESIRTPFSGSSLPESHARVPSLESGTNFWSDQKPYSAAYDKYFQPLDSCMNDCKSVKKSSPALVIRPPSIGTSSTVPNIVSSGDVSSIGNVAAINSKDFGCHYPFNQKELGVLLGFSKEGCVDTSRPHLPVERSDHFVSSIGNVAAINSKDFGCHYPSNQRELGVQLGFGKEGCLDTSRPNLPEERSDHFFDASSSTRKEELSNKLVTEDALDHMSKAGMKFQLPDINVPDGFTLALDSAKGFTSFGDSFEGLDHYNPAVDSPCWKGAPISLFSPSEGATPQHHMKKSEACNSLNLQQTQIFPPCNDETVKVSCLNLCENSVYQQNGYVELGSLLCPERLSNANCPPREHGSTDAVKAGFNMPKMSSSNEVQFSNDTDKPKKEYDVPNDSKSDPDLTPSHTKQPGLDKGEFISEREFSLSTDVTDTDLNINDTAEDGSVPFHGMKSTSWFPCSAEGVNKLSKLHATESTTPKVDVQMLVNTIHNLSELLLFHCTNDAFAVSEQDHDALKHVINNLDACVPKKMVHRTPTRGSMCPRQGTFRECRKLPDLPKVQGVIVGRPPVTNGADSSSHGRFDHHCMHEGQRNGNLFGKEVEKFLDFVPLRDDADIVKDDNMVQAIKQVLKDDFDGEEEVQSETMLYKNLWLEAEAALCSISHRARFNRVKIEMEKCKSHDAKDVAETNNKTGEKLPSSKFSPDANISHKVKPEAKDSPVSNNSIQDSSITSTTKIVDDVEDSVMARFHILKCRCQNSNSVNTEGQQLAEAVDAGIEGKRNDPFMGDQYEEGGLDVADGPHSQYCGGSSKVDKFGSYVDGFEHETLKEFHGYATDDQVILSSKNNRLGSQLPSGWCDSSSSDWEHVLKDEFACQN